MKKMGFNIEYSDDGTVRATLDLRGEELIPCNETRTLRERQIETQQPQMQQEGKKETEAVSS